MKCWRKFPVTGLSLSFGTWKTLTVKTKIAVRVSVSYLKPSNSLRVDKSKKWRKRRLGALVDILPRDMH